MGKVGGTAMWIEILVSIADTELPKPLICAKVKTNAVATKRIKRIAESGFDPPSSGL
jgi:hypothetical protein